MRKSKILITGATGFVGSLLVKKLEEIGIAYIAHSRSSNASLDSNRYVGDIGPDTDWTSVLSGVDVVIHLAARVHVMNDDSTDPLVEFRKVNVEGTLNLAMQSSIASVKRFIFISSVKVNGESTTGLNVFLEDSHSTPEDAYGVSKLEAETGLQSIASETGMEVVIIRPPLVYGAGVKANFLSLLKLSATHLPLPFGSINNRRSMIYIGNLVDFIIKCTHHSAAANQKFLISDGEDVSLRFLITLIRSEFGVSPRLLPFPIALFILVGICTGKRQVVDRLVGDLQVDSSKARTLLDWQPPFSLADGIAATVQDFKNRKK